MLSNRLLCLQGMISKKKLNFTIYLLLLIATFFCYPTLENLIKHWTKWDQALSHAIPTLALMGYLLWQLDFKEQRRKKTKSQLFLLLSLGLSSGLWFLFQINHIELLAAIMWVTLVGLYIAACLSWKTLKQLSPTLALMLFIIPIWPQLNDLLVNMSGSVVGYLIYTFKIPAFIESNTIQIPSGLIVIADGCSGLRYLIVACLLGYTIGLLNKSNYAQNIALIFSSVALALIANWIRIFILILIGYHTEMQSSLMQDHELFGWFVFGTIMIPAIYFSPIAENTSANTVSFTMATPVLATLMLALGPAMYVFANQQKLAANPYTLGIPSDDGKLDFIKQEVQLSILNNTTVESERMSIDDIEIRIDLIKKSAAANEKLVPYIDTIYDKQIWQNIETQSIQIQDGSYQIHKLKQLKTHELAIIFQQYNVGKTSTGNYLWAKLLQLKARALNQQYFAMLVLQAHCQIECKSETEMIINVAKSWEAKKSK